MFSAEWLYGAAQLALLFGLFGGAFVAAVEGFASGDGPADPPAAVKTRGGK